MKKLLAAIAFAALTASAEDFPTIIIERPLFDGVVIVDGAQPTPFVGTVTPIIETTPVVYDQPVVYTAPVQYNAPVVYNGPVIYANTTVTPTRSACADDCGGISITVRSGRNCHRNCNVTVIGRGSASVR
jgi:hypothetical protein